jgi:hypothetical protein
MKGTYKGVKCTETYSRTGAGWTAAGNLFDQDNWLLSAFMNGKVKLNEYKKMTAGFKL